MRGMRSRSIAAMAIVIAGGALLGSSTPGSGAASGPDGVTLTYWTSLDEPPEIAALIDDFERETGVVVEAVTLAPSYEAEALSLWDRGERPDVMLFLPDRSWMLALDPTRTLVDLSGEDFAERYLAGIDSVGRIDDGLYAAVFGYPEVYGMLYDREGAGGYRSPPVSTSCTRPAATTSRRGVRARSSTSGAKEISAPWTSSRRCCGRMRSTPASSTRSRPGPHGSRTTGSSRPSTR